MYLLVVYTSQTYMHARVLSRPAFDLIDLPVCRVQRVRLRNPKSEGLWLEAVRLERRANNGKGAESLMAKALQECPGSGVLWAEEILVAQRAEQKSESVVSCRDCCPVACGHSFCR